jgi:hypothetical protein
MSKLFFNFLEGKKAFRFFTERYELGNFKLMLDGRGHLCTCLMSLVRLFPEPDDDDILSFPPSKIMLLIFYSLKLLSGSCSCSSMHNMNE